MDPVETKSPEVSEHTLATLAEIGEEINASLDLDKVLARAGILIKRLIDYEILSVLLEAGPTLNGAALSAGLVHKLMLFYAPKFAGDLGVPFAHMSTLAHGPLPNLRVEQFGPDVAIEAYLRDVYRAM